MLHSICPLTSIALFSRVCCGKTNLALSLAEYVNIYSQAVYGAGFSIAFFSIMTSWILYVACFYGNLHSQYHLCKIFSCLYCMVIIMDNHCLFILFSLLAYSLLLFLDLQILWYYVPKFQPLRMKDSHILKAQFSYHHVYYFFIFVYGHL